MGRALLWRATVIIPKVNARGPEKFYELVCDAGVTVLQSDPKCISTTYGHASYSNGEQHRLRLVIFGGEALDDFRLEAVVQWTANLHTQLVNMYGITETTVHVTYYPLSLPTRRGAEPVQLAVRFPICAYIFLTHTANRRRSASQANSMSAAPVWRGAI